MAHSVGKTIATLRKEKGWTQLELAKRLGISDKAVSKWESDGGLPDTAIFPMIAEIFEVSIDYLMTGPKEKRKVSTPPINNPSNLSIEEQEKKIAETIHNGIINVNELLATKNFSIIQKAFAEHPVHPFEIDYANLMKLYDALENHRWKELFVYAVDHMKNETMVMAILNHNVDEIKNQLTAMGDGYVQKWTVSYDPYSRSKESYYSPNTLCLKNETNNNKKLRHSLENILTYINKCKAQIIEEASLKWDKEKTIGNLTKEYFYDELSKDNIEMVIIKLCVRLEAILKSDYHYEGDLSEMLKQFCSQYGYYEEDDGWGYFNSRERDFVKPLHKLRKTRNSIVHSEKIEEEMTEEELEFCIDYICQMG